MNLSLGITILLGTAGMVITLLIAIKQGVFKKIRLEFSPSKILNAVNDGLIDFKPGKNPRIPAIAILRFFEWRKNGFDAISSHIYLTLENRSKYAVEGINLAITYPSQYFDQSDKHFFRFESIGLEEDGASYTLISDTRIQIQYKIKELHPHSIRNIVHPLYLPIPILKSP